MEPNHDIREKARILLVDDHEENLIALEAVLKDLGHVLITARSGEEALKKAFNDDFAVILLDVSMPGIDGIETAQLLRQRQRSSFTPIIFLTAFARSDMQRMRAYVAGAVDLIIKPIEPEILRSKVSVFVMLYEQRLELQRQAVLLRRSMMSVVEEKKRTEAERRRREELEQFAHIASHDLKEPLRAMNTFAQLLGRRFGKSLGPDGNEFVEHIVTGATRIYKLIDNLVKYADLNSDTYTFGATDCNRAVDDALAKLKPAIGQSEAIVTSDALPTVTASAAQMVKLFENIISNSIKFRDSASPPEIQIRVTRGNDAWMFEISDNGIGFDPQYAERIFLLFKKLHPQEVFPGTGIGLAICKRIVEKHRGRIWAHSEPGRGTTVFFTLPFVESAAGKSFG